MKKQLGIILLFLLFALPARSVEACMGCLNSVTAVKYPFTGSVIGLFLGWLVVSFILGRPLSLGIKRFFYVGVPILAIGTFIMNPLGFGLLVISCWLIYLFFKVLQFITIKDEWIRHNLKQFGLNVIALTVSFVLISSSMTQANSTPGQIQLLGRASPLHSNVTQSTIFNLTQRDQEAIPPLIEALELEFARGNDVNTYRTSPIAYCLSQIGGKEAEAALKRVIQQQLDLQEPAYAKWQTVILCSYAECARERAVPLLLELLNSSESENINEQRCIVLCALARTGDLTAIEAVLDRSEFLRDSLDEKLISNWRGAVICLTLQALAEGQDQADLVASPIYEKMTIGLRLASQTKTGIKWNDRWRKKLDSAALKAHWAEILE